MIKKTCMTRVSLKKVCVRLCTSILGLAAGTLIPEYVLANGSLPYAQGARMVGVGGAGVAYPFDPTSGNVNPALVAKIGNEIAIDPGIVFQNISVDTSTTGLVAGSPFPPQPGPLKNKINEFPVAYGGITYNINPDWSIGAALTGGGNLINYPTSIASPALQHPKRLLLSAALLSPTVAYKPTSNQAYGFSIILGNLELKTDQTLFPSEIVTKGMNRTDQAFGLGLRIGGQWDVNKTLTLGAAVSSPVVFQKFKKYDDALKYCPKIPAILTGGIAWHLTSKTDILFDLEGLFWQESSFTGKRPPLGPGWRNRVVTKVGVVYKILESLNILGGFNYGRTPMPKSDVLFNSLNGILPIAEKVITAGVSCQVTKTVALDLSMCHWFQNTLTDDGTGVAGLAARGLKLKGNGYGLVAGFKWKY